MRITKTLKHGWICVSAAIGAALLVGCGGYQSDSTKDTGVTPSKSAKASETKSPEPTTQAVDFTNENGELVCPVSGDVIASKDKAAGHSDHDGKRYYFCCAACPPKFKAEPAKYAEGRAIKSGEAKSMHGG